MKRSTDLHRERGDKMFADNKKSKKLSGEKKNISKDENKELELDKLDHVAGGGLGDMPVDKNRDISEDTKNKI